MASNRRDLEHRRPVDKELLIILDDLDFTWTREEISFVIKAWESGLSLATICRRLERKRNPLDALDEVALLIIHLRRQRKIGIRPGGYFGKEAETPW